MKEPEADHHHFLEVLAREVGEGEEVEGEEVEEEVVVEEVGEAVVAGLLLQSCLALELEEEEVPLYPCSNN